MTTATMIKKLEAELAAASAALNADLASWEYAFAMGSRLEGAENHPIQMRTRARTDQLVARYRDVRALLGEYVL